MAKKFGGVIRNWQLHHLTLKKNDLKEFKKIYPEVLFKPGPVIFTGTVKSDPTKRFQKGFHMRSSYIVLINRKKGIIETVNTIYKVIKEGGDIYPDLGNDILNVSYY